MKIKFLLLIIFLSELYGEDTFYLDKKKELIFFTSGILLNTASMSINYFSDEKELGILSENDIPSYDSFWYRTEIDDTYNLLSNVSLMACFSLPIIPIIKNNNEWFTVSLMYAETLLIANGSKELIKSLIDKERPYAYGDNPEIDEDIFDSFPSGHSTMAFASAVYASYVYSKLNPDSKLKIPFTILNLSLASSVAYCRIEAGKHFPSDVISGALLGSFIGYIVPYSHLNKDKNFPVSITNNSISFTFNF